MVVTKSYEVIQEIEEISLNAWPSLQDSFVHLDGMTLSKESLTAILRNIASKKCFAVLLKDNQVVSCGLGVLENQYIGLFEIITAKTERRKGFGKELILNILNWAKQNGAQKAYLQVVMNNKPALNLYSKLGFQEVYQYFYRIKLKSSQF